MPNFNSEGQCPENYQRKGFCHTYFFKEFNEYPSVVRIENEDYIDHIKTFHDPILIYVALYLYHNYGIAQKYFKNNEVYSYNNDACNALNRWLDQQKNFYTDFGTCYYNRRWWDFSIEPLLEKLEKYFHGKKCKRNYPYHYKEAPLKDNDKQRRRYQQMPEDFVCYKDNSTKSQQGNHGNNSIEENCAKLSILFYLGEKYKLLGENTNEQNNTDNKYCNETIEKINYNPVLKAEKTYFCKSLINTIALPIVVTVLGTIFLAFFLNEFTPMGSILRTRSKYKVRKHDQYNEESGYN